MKWIEDSLRDSCNLCLRKFTISVRRHHCRRCGEIFCRICCPKLHGMRKSVGVKRICVLCHANSYEIHKVVPSPIVETSLAPSVHEMTSPVKQNHHITLSKMIVIAVAALYAGCMIQYMLFDGTTAFFILCTLGVLVATAYFYTKDFIMVELDTVDENSKQDSVEEPVQSVQREFSDSEKRVLAMRDTMLDTTKELCVKHTIWRKEKSTLKGVDMYSSGQDQHTYSVKLFKSIGVMPFSAKFAMDILHYNGHDQPKWNPTILQNVPIWDIDTDTQIIYTVASAAAGGLVAARDFVTARFAKTEYNEARPPAYISAGCGVSMLGLKENEYKIKHKVPNATRGVAGPSGFYIEPIMENGEHTKCRITWVVNSDLKGWLPKKLIDTAITGVMADFMTALKAYGESMSTNDKNDISIHAVSQHNSESKQSIQAA